MSVEPNLSVYPGCLRAIDDDLSAMLRRRGTLMAVSTPTQELLAEISIIYSNVAYIFMYLEGNHHHLDYTFLMPYYEAFFNNHQQDEQMLALLAGLHCADPKAEADKHRWLMWLDERVRPPQPVQRHQIENLYAEAQHVLHEIDEDRAALLQRLGMKMGGASAAAMFYRTVSSTESSVIRSKLALAWHRVPERHRTTLLRIIDEIINERRQQTRTKGYNTVLAETFQRCSISESDAWKFIQVYLAQSLNSHVKLTSNIREATGCQDNPLDHCGYYLRTLMKGTQLPFFKFDACLDYLFSIANRVFGLTIERNVNDNPDVITVAAHLGNAKVGTINFDLLDTRHNHAATDALSMIGQTYPIERVACPLGHVLCRFQYGENGVRHMTFEAVHSFFHEFGHALTYLLIRSRLPNQSGLEYLPLERLENLSMWFEKWVYHPQFAAHLSLTAEEREGLALCQRIKKIEFLSTNLESAVTAALDFDIHRHSEGGLEQSFQRLDDEFGIANHLPLTRLLHYLTAPMFRANPGAGLVYVWGAADSTQKFTRFVQSGTGDAMANQAFATLFGSYFDPSESSIEPDAQAVFDFYGTTNGK